MIIFDIGACVGIFTDHFLQKEDEVEIYAFEPLKTNYDYLVDKYKNRDNVHVFEVAVSDMSGTKKFYKKEYNRGRGYDFIGNAGCSLKKLKNNVSKDVFDEVEVISLSKFMERQVIHHIDILKIDTEGSEYDIIRDLLLSGKHKRIDKIMYEDHCRKVVGLCEDRKEVLRMIRDLGIEEKFYLQDELGDHLRYYPLTEAKID